MQSFDLDGNLTFEADHGLVYDAIFQHVRLVVYISNGTVHSYTLMPKLKRCKYAREAVGTYYAPL
jgi:hypothetical protein